MSESLTETSMSKAYTTTKTSIKQTKNNTTTILNPSSFNPSLEINLDKDTIFRSCSNINMDYTNINIDDIPVTERRPPPLTKRLNIELENIDRTYF